MSRSTISQTASRDLVEILDYFTNIILEALKTHLLIMRI